MSITEIQRNKYTIEIEQPEMYVNHQKTGRSGHMTHAMAAFAPGCFIDFNSNCSGVRWRGHSPFGWVEYRISKDAGRSYSDVHTLPYSMDSLLDGLYAISVEKAVACDDGTIVAFCLRNDATQYTSCEPWETPYVVRSFDGGQTWTDAVECIPHKGRIYDALYHDGTIYVMIFCNENFHGSKPEHVYRIYKSNNCGESFEEVCIVPFETLKRGYCAMIFDQSGALHAYAYNEEAETELDHAISYDKGKSWTVLPPCYVAKGIRNPQIAFIDGVYILHGRSGGYEGFVLYTSEDAAVWDEGFFLVRDKGAAAFYSNNLNLQDEKGDFLLIQYSERYEECRVNIMHTRLRVKR